MEIGGGSARDRCRDAVHVVIVAICIGMIVGWVSLQLRLQTRADVLHNLTAVLHGTPLVFGDDHPRSLPFYNRLMFPAVHQGLVKAFPLLSPSQWYLLLRQFSFVLAFVAFGLICLRALGASRRQTMLSTALFALCVVASFNHPWEETSDALDLLALALGTGAALTNRFGLCLLVAIAFAANRESAAFLGVIWFFVAPSAETKQAWVKQAAQSAVLCVASYGVTLGIRFLNPAPETGQNHFALWHNIGLLTPVRGWQLYPTGVPAMLLAATILLLINVDRTAARARRLLWVAAVLLVPAVLFGALNELRVFLPSILMVAFAVAASEASRDGKA